jgi:hypothetical protein
MSCCDFINRTCTLWLCLSCVRKTSDNTEDLMSRLIAGQPLSSRTNFQVNKIGRRFAPADDGKEN